MREPKINIMLEDGYYVPSSVLWLLADELSIKHVALLILNEDPERYQKSGWRFDPGAPAGYLAIEEALMGALRKGKIAGQIKECIEEWGAGEGREIPDTIDPDTSKIDMDSLREWLAEKNVEINHLFELVPTIPMDCRHKEHHHYSPKLAATIAAWDAVSANFQAHISVKDQLRSWLQANAAEFGVADDELKPTKNFLDAACLIANWNTTGGRTPLQKPDSNVLEKSDNENRVPAPFKLTPAEKPTPIQGSDLLDDFDDEIPF